MTAMITSVYDWGESFLWQRVWGLSLAAWAFVTSGLLAYIGLLWDGAWHASWGRDTFFIPPHDMMYGGITLSVAVAVAILVTSSRRPRDPSMVQIGPLQAPLAIWIALFGTVIMFSAAAYDDWWHNNIGHVEGDIVLWSPPHLIGMIGGLFALTGSLLFVLREVRTPALVNGRPIPIWKNFDMPSLGLLLMLTYLTFQIGGMSLDRWTIYDKLRFDGSVYPILALVFGPAVLVLTQRISNRAGAATFAVVVPFLLSGIMGLLLKEAGFPRVASMPIMAIPGALLLDLAFARFGRGYKYLLILGPFFVLVFYGTEFLWAWYLTHYPWWPIENTLRAIPVGIVIGTASLLLGAWVSEWVERAGIVKREGRRPGTVRIADTH